MLDDQSIFIDQNERIYKNEIESLQQKVKDYRIKLKEMEQLLQESDLKRLDSMKNLENLTISELKL